MRQSTRAACVVLLALFTAGAACRREETPSLEVLLQHGDAHLREGRYGDAAAALQTAVEGAPRDSGLRFKFAEALYRSGDRARAASETIRAADLAPDDLEMQVHASAMLMALTRFLDARARVDGVLEKAPQHVGALIVWSHAIAELQYPDAALWAFDQSLRDGEDPERYVFRRRAKQISAQKDQEAVSALRRALDIAPADVIARTALANVLFASGRNADAEEHLRFVADRPRPGEWPYLRLDPTGIVPRVLGEWLMRSGRGADGAKYLRHALALGDEGALIPLAEHDAGAGRIDEAMALLARASERLDANGAVSISVARIQLGAGRGDDAMRRIDQLLARQPNHGPALLLKAKRLSEMRRAAEALPVARAAAQQLPSSGEARVTFAEALLATGDADAAFKEFIEVTRTDANVSGAYLGLTRAAMALERDKEAVVFARDAARRFPDDRNTRLLLAKALTQAGDYAAAESELQRVLTRDPRWAHGLAQLGDVHARRRNVAAARAAYMRALDATPALHEAVAGLVALELAAGSPASARDVAKKALVSHPDDPDFLVLMARAEDGAGDTARAEAALRKALSRNRAHSAATILLAGVLARRGQTDQAIQSLQTFLNEHPQAADAELQLAELLDAAGRRAEAITRYERIVEQNPVARGPASSLASLYLSEGRDLDKALELATRVRNQNPADPAINSLIVAIHLKSGNAWRAIPVLQQMVAQQPDHARYRYQLGFALIKGGEESRGARELRRALQLDPSLPEAAEARDALRIGR